MTERGKIDTFSIQLHERSLAPLTNFPHTTGVISGAGTDCPSGAPEFTPGF